jgi:hypothetical protein
MTTDVSKDGRSLAEMRGARRSVSKRRDRQLMRAACLARAIALAVVVGFASFSPASSAEPLWEIAVAGNGRIAVPTGWRKMGGIRPGLAIYRLGDGIGVPITDETGEPLQIGIVVEAASPDASTLAAVLEALKREARRDPRLDLKNQTVQSFGSEAALLSNEYIKEKSRRSLQMKFVSRAPDGKFWIVSGFLVGGMNSAWPVPASKLASWLRAHVTSLSWDKNGPDTAKLDVAYKAFRGQH